MKIHVYSVMWNEEFILPYFLRHYTQFADVFIINHHCTDKTLEIAKNKATILDYPFHRQFTERDHSRAFKLAYEKYSKGADLVMCVDADEFILNEKLDGDLIKVTSYMMISEKPPTTDGQIYDEIKTGVRMRSFDKPIIFNPLLDIRFGNGRHTVEAGIEPLRTGVRMLHYKYLGKNYYFERSRLVYPRKDKTDEVIDYRLKRGLKWYDDHINKATKVI